VKAKQAVTLRRGLAEARKRAGHTQQSLREQIGVIKHTISQWETGHSAPSPRTRPRLARALAVSLEELDRLIRGEALAPPDGTMLERLVRADPERARRVLESLGDASATSIGERLRLRGW
jgi:transcriptional regulator with XRE-family HTH domain